MRAKVRAVVRIGVEGEASMGAGVGLGVGVGVVSRAQALWLR